MTETPMNGRFMSRKAGQLCAFSMQKGVNKIKTTFYEHYVFMEQILSTFGIIKTSPPPLKWVGFEDVKNAKPKTQYFTPSGNRNNMYSGSVTTANNPNGHFFGFHSGLSNSHYNTYLVNTLPSTEQQCLIPFTVPATEEEIIINDLMENEQFDYIQIIIYGKHSADPSAEIKYNQFVKLGFRRVFIYGGGLFEWLLLQDIYGDTEFPTTTNVVDILKYRPPSFLCV